MVQFTDDPRVRGRIVFLPDYDMAMARSLVRGCDVWLNNPLRPLEACGTSGMKAALNGGLNLSVRDGWWDEWYDGGNGWEIPSADGVPDPDRRDELEASALYDLLGNSVAPLFYGQDADGVPDGWVEMIRHTLRVLGPRVPAERMVRDYVTTLYAPATTSSRALADGGSYRAARELAAWKRRVEMAWPAVRIEHVEADAGEPRLGAPLDRARRGRARRAHPGRRLRRGGLRPRRRARRAGRPVLRPAVARRSTRGAAARPYATPVRSSWPSRARSATRSASCPSHPLLASRAELGLVTVPDAPAGMTNGDLR